jgi:hypothetical protein
MGNLDKALAAQDRILFNPPCGDEWSDADINEAIDALESAIINDNETWDEDGTYHVDFSLTVEKIILNEPKDEQLALIKDAFNKAVHDYSVSVVRHDPSTYCALYCDRG